MFKRTLITSILLSLLAFLLAANLLYVASRQWEWVRQNWQPLAAYVIAAWIPLLGLVWGILWQRSKYQRETQDRVGTVWVEAVLREEPTSLTSSKWWVDIRARREGTLSITISHVFACLQDRRRIKLDNAPISEGRVPFRLSGNDDLQVLTIAHDTLVDVLKTENVVLPDQVGFVLTSTLGSSEMEYSSDVIGLPHG